MNKYIEYSNTYDAATVFHAITKVKSDKFIVSSLLTDSLFHISSDLFLADFIYLLSKNIDRLSLPKLEGIMLAFNEWNIHHAFSGEASDVLLDIVSNRIIGGDAEDALWINNALNILSQSFSYIRLRRLVLLMCRQRPLVSECFESYMKTFKMNLNFAIIKKDIFKETANEIVTLIQQALDEKSPNEKFLKSGLEILNEKRFYKSKKFILFIHGLGSTPQKTWGNFKKLIQNDAQLQFDTDYFKYSSRKFRIPFFSEKQSSIQLLSKALKTYIDDSLYNYDEIVLICHSLGGLIVKKYLIKEFFHQRKIKVTKVIFYATPHEGSQLANVKKLISPFDNLIRQLAVNNDFLNELNDDWINSGIETKVKFLYVIGEKDKVVPESSAKWIAKAESEKTLVGKDHSTICSPLSETDKSFIVAKKFISNDVA